MPSIKIELIPLFSSLLDKNYSIIKLPTEFPEYKPGSDLDIFCYDIDDIAKVIVGFLAKDFNIKIAKKELQIYIDIIDRNDEIHFRFDLYAALPAYNNLLIKEAFFSSIIENSQIIEKNGCQVKVPCLIDETILRYIEYQEWYAQRPDKIKHIEYIESKICNSELTINQLLDKLHFYTALPIADDNRKLSSSRFVRNLNYLLFIGRKFFNSLKEKGLMQTLKKVTNKVLR